MIKLQIATVLMNSRDANTGHVRLPITTKPQKAKVVQFLLKQSAVTTFSSHVQ